MSTATIPPFGRGSLAVGSTGHQFHIHLLGAAILREQLHDGDVMIEASTGAKVVRMRTELQTKPPRRPAAAPTIPTPRQPEPPTADVRMVFPVIDERTVRLIRGTVQTARHTR